MHRSKLLNNFLRRRSNENGKKYLKQQNYCVSLSRRIKKNYYSNLNEKNITGDKKFWKTITPFLLDKFLSTERIDLTEIDKIINFNVPEHHDCEGLSGNNSDPILKVIAKYRNHPSIRYKRF